MTQSSSNPRPSAGAPAGAAAPRAPALHPSLRRLGVEVQGRVDEYLVRVDLELARRRATPAQRRDIGVALRNRIIDKLAARIGDVPADAAVHLSAADADAVLAELGPAEKYAADAIPQRPAAARYTGPKKLEKLSLLGLAWALMFPLMIALSRVPMHLAQDQPPPWYALLQVIVIPLGWSAVLAPTVLGLLAIDRIRKSNGRLYGMSLALFVAVLYPLLALDWAVFWICWKVAGSLLAQQAIGEPLSKLITQVIPTVACVLGDYFIVARAWMAVNEE